MATHSSSTTRMSIDVTAQDHKRIKMFAAAEGVSIRDFVIECISEKIYPEKVKHPNKTTRKAMVAARKGKTIKAKDFAEICKKAGI